MSIIEEVDSAQFIKHYFDKVYTELEQSPESFIRAALEYVHGEAALLSQPGALDSLRRLAEDIAHPEGASPSAPSTAPAPRPVPVPMQTTGTTSAGTSAQEGPRQATPPASTEMPDASATDAEEDGDVAESSGIQPNAGNGADLQTYSWTQTLNEVVVTAPVPKGTKGRDCDVSITRNTLRLGLRGAPAPVLSGDFYAPVQPDESMWNLVDGSSLELTLQKVDCMQWWKAVVKGEPEIDTQAVEPESSKLTDLDPEMRATVEKMMFDQRQKALGLPTSEESKKEQIMKQFVAAHPEMDFSGAKFNI